MTHELKSWPKFFQPIIDGKKTFEIRLNDRGFKPGDTLLLQEWEPETKTYTGREAFAHVPYILGSDDHCAVSPKALRPEYVVMSIAYVVLNKDFGGTTPAC